MARPKFRKWAENDRIAETASMEDPERVVYLEILTAVSCKLSERSWDSAGRMCWRDATSLAAKRSSQMIWESQSPSRLDYEEGSEVRSEGLLAKDP